MHIDERRLILARGFERTMETVLDAFLHEGFTVTPIDAGDLRHRSHGCPHEGCSLRYALLEATVPELKAPSSVAGAASLPACRLSVFELNGACTLVTAENTLVRYPLLESLARGAADRMGNALRLIMRRDVSTAA
jgi:hypothetical protein